MDQALLQVKNLSVAFKNEKVVDAINFEVYPSETFALVGESGSGKSITALSVLRLLPAAAHFSATDITLQNESLLTITESNFCKIRGRRIAFIFQDPTSSLNPVMTIGDQIAEVIQIHFNLSKTEVKNTVFELLRQVEIPVPERRINEYPHQLSGGQRQRVMIAIALAGKPDLLIADEPTTALDVTIQAQILSLLKSIQAQTGMALWLISHDLALVSNMADRIAVMQNGKIVETNTTPLFFKQAKHPYSLSLLAALPSMQSCIGKTVEFVEEQESCLLKVENFKVYYPIRKGFFKRIVDHVKAVDDVSFNLYSAKTLALVGESGCGKTTLGKGLLRLIPHTAGRVLLNNIDLTALTGSTVGKMCSEIQIVFQDPFAAMNPRMLVGEIIEEGIKSLHPEINIEQRQQRVRHLLQQVELPQTAVLRYPHEFSGGQRQRICIARALAVEPKLIVCDEPTSALDVSVQAQIIKLFKNLQQEHGISYLFITHDLAVVAEIADDVAVMYQGKIVELGKVEQVLMHPKHQYTQKLLDAVPVI
ncbi:MAG: ABC transporter ATP-binding protein [Methylococcales symbiont of Iophon sp. n. MRB-2018]|nr:MAG: ABC transporter ATP-binding protein [Methylococcales symbiont of Iophon sp. n. MRB-2018]KAF3979831.1 MAG: ABC transporter ATP-binding protein [Methylococcales symbiont of Iophon sp. n. MRB-2018]